MQSESQISSLFNHLKISINMLPITRYKKIYIPHILWNLKIHRRLKNSPPLVSILSQINPVHSPTNPISLRWIFNIIVPSPSRSSKWSLPFKFPHQNPVRTAPLPHKCHMPRPSNQPLFYHKIMWRAVQSWSPSFSNFSTPLLSRSS